MIFSCKTYDNIFIRQEEKNEEIFEELYVVFGRIFDNPCNTVDRVSNLYDSESKYHFNTYILRNRWYLRIDLACDHSFFNNKSVFLEEKNR